MSSENKQVSKYKWTELQIFTAFILTTKCHFGSAVNNLALRRPNPVHQRAVASGTKDGRMDFVVILSSRSSCMEDTKKVLIPSQTHLFW